MLKGMTILLVLLFASCDVFRGGDPHPKTSLSEREFVDVYVELTRARTPEAKDSVLKKHGTTQRELEAFVRAYTANLPALSTVFDSVVARFGPQGPPDLPPRFRR